MPAPTRPLHVCRVYLGLRMRNNGISGTSGIWNKRGRKVKGKPKRRSGANRKPRKINHMEVKTNMNNRNVRAANMEAEAEMERKQRSCMSQTKDHGKL